MAAALAIQRGRRPIYFADALAATKMNRRLFPAVALLLALIRGAAAQSSMPVFADSLQNGYQSWSWATINFNNSSPVFTGTKSIAVTMGGYQALALNRSEFMGRLYSGLRFSVCGGSSGGQRFVVKAAVSGAGQPAEKSFGPLPGGNTWVTYDVSLAELGVANSTALTGFWWQSSVGSTQATMYVDDIKLLPTAVIPTAKVTTDALPLGKVIPSYMAGLNVAVWDGSLGTTNTRTNLVNLKSKILRYPGGSLSDSYHWATNKTDDGASWASDFNTFANLLTSSNHAGMITVNYGSGTPSEAASWVSNANITRGLGIKYWEVGNECYGTWENDTNTRPHDPVTYATRFAQYVTAMKAVDPTIKIGLPVTYQETDFANYTDQSTTNQRTGLTTSGYTPLVLNKLKMLGVTPDFVVIHEYPIYTPAENDDLLLQVAPNIAADVARTRQMLTDYLGPTSPLVEIHMTEANSNAGTPGKQMCSLVNGLYYADLFGTLIATELKSFFWWDWSNGKDFGGNNASYLYGWRNYGDFGLAGSSTDKYPNYYCFRLMSLFVAGGDRYQTCSSDNQHLGAYAARNADGGVSVLLINKTPATAIDVTLDLRNYAMGSTYTIHKWGFAQDEAARTGSGLRDISTSNLTGAKTGLKVTVPGYTAYVVKFKKAAANVEGDHPIK